VAGSRRSSSRRLTPRMNESSGATAMRTRMTPVPSPSAMSVSTAITTLPASQTAAGDGTVAGPASRGLHAFPPASTQPREDVLRHGIGLGENRRTRLLQDLLTRQRGRLRREVRIEDAAARRGQVLDRRLDV